MVAAISFCSPDFRNLPLEGGLCFPFQVKLGTLYGVGFTMVYHY